VVRLGRLRVLLPLALAAGLACAGEPVPQIVEVGNAGLDELSGLVVSRADPQVLWGHNDTGGGAWLYRFGLDGADLGRVAIPGAQAHDWEALAAFEHDGAPALLVADVGDNLASRAVVTLYAVSDPGRDGAARLLWRLPLRFPDGARDCEAVAVDPVAREILLVSKRDTPPRLYRVPLPAGTPAGVQQAAFVAGLSGWPARNGLSLLRFFADSPTAFDISRDGRRAVIATPTHAYLYRRPDDGDWARGLQRAQAAVPLPSRALDQIEAAAFTADGRALIVGSEGKPARLARIALPQ
jgi:hypothetical protein